MNSFSAFLGAFDLSRDDSNEQMIPLIVADEVPLADMVRNLARRARLNYLVDTSISSEWVRAHSQPRVSLRWENLTPRQALAHLLADDDLEYVVDPRTQIARIVRRTARPGNVQADWQTEEQVGAILSRFAGLEPKGPRVQSLRSVTGAFVLFSGTSVDAPGSSLRARILLRTQDDLYVEDVQNLLQAAAWNTFIDVRRLQVASREEDVFQVFVNPPQFCEARDYLALTKRFEQRYEVLRQELATPMPRMDIDYPFNKERCIPNFGPLRVVAQTLAQRAQAHLLSGQSAAALSEIRLCQDLGERLAHPAAGGPVPLIAAMMPRRRHAACCHDGERRIRTQDMAGTRAFRPAADAFQDPLGPSSRRSAFVRKSHYVRRPRNLLAQRLRPDA